MSDSSVSSYQAAHVFHELQQVDATLTFIWEQVHMQGIVPDEVVRLIETAQGDVEQAANPVRYA